VAGVPLMTPLSPSSDIPAGNIPVATTNVGAGKPSATTCPNEGASAWNRPTVSDTIVGAVAGRLPVNVALANPAAFVAVISKL
jgi:hypothetical protein